MADCSPSALMQASKCFQCLPRGMLLSLRSYLLCQWSNLPTCDPDALTYIATAGITNQTEIDAVCQLVASLKSLPAVGTKYWDRELIIYPFLGTTFASQRVNLRNPGTFDFVEAGAPTYSNLGMKGNAVVHVDTQFTPSLHGDALYTQNSARVMVYVDLEATAQFLAHFGAQGPGTLCVRMLSPAFPPTMNFIYDVNNNAGNLQSAAGAMSLGAKFVQRNNDPNNIESTFGANAWTARAKVSTGLPGFPIWLLGLDNGGAISFPSDCRLSGFSLGAPLDVGHGAGVHTEHLEYKGIWDTFEAAVNPLRGHP